MGACITCAPTRSDHANFHAPTMHGSHVSSMCARVCHGSALLSLSLSSHHAASQGEGIRSSKQEQVTHSTHTYAHTHTHTHTHTAHHRQMDTTQTQQTKANQSKPKQSTHDIHKHTDIPTAGHKSHTHVCGVLCDDLLMCCCCALLCVDVVSLNTNNSWPTPNTRICP